MGSVKGPSEGANRKKRAVFEATKRSAGNRIGCRVIDRQIEDRQTGRNKADERWYPSGPCSVLNSDYDDD